MKLTGTNLVLLALVFVVYGTTVLAAFVSLGSNIGMAVAVLVGVAIPTLVAVESYRRGQSLAHSHYQLLTNQLVAHYRQLEALQSLYASLSCAAPLPPMRGWAISPDFAVILIAEIREKQPQTIVEAGSGVSTLVGAYCLKDIGKGRMFSLEHDRAYAQIARSTVASHGLDHLADVHHAPLISYDIDGHHWQWYDLNSLGSVDEIDMLIIDGPPGDVQALARYPALPLLVKRLRSDATILLDDAGRQEEQDIVDRWLKEFPEFEGEFVATERGAAILRRRSKEGRSGHAQNGRSNRTNGRNIA